MNKNHSEGMKGGGVNLHSKVFTKLNLKEIDVM
jgi:hypothetical protein